MAAGRAVREKQALIEAGNERAQAASARSGAAGDLAMRGVAVAR
jgi:hypothetical protein